jgi:hypothetical protein
LDILEFVPIMSGIDLGHGGEEDGQDMCKAEIEEDNFD